MKTAALPDVLLPYQVEAIVQSHAHPLYVCEKSRRTGITYGFAADAVLTAAATKGGQNVFYIAYNLDMTREFIDYCSEFAKAFDCIVLSAPKNARLDELRPLNDEGDEFAFKPGNTHVDESGGFLFDDGSEKGIKAFRIDFPSGHYIMALSSKPRSLRGKQGVVIIDEAAFHDQLDELLKAALALLMWGGRVVVVSTHDGADNPFASLIDDIRAGKRDGYVQRITLKDALAQGLYKRICLRTGETWSPEAQEEWERKLRAFYGDAAEEELDVTPARGSGTYLARATIAAAMSPKLPVVRICCPDGFEREADEFRTDWIREQLEDEVKPYLDDFDRDRRTFFGQDFARSGDVSPIIFGQHDQTARLVARATIEMRNVPFREQEFLLNWMIARVPLFAAGKMDGRGNGSALAEAMQQRWGFDRVEAVNATDAVYLNLMPKLRAAIEDGMIQLPQDEDVLEDFRMIKLVRGVPKIPDRSVVSKTDGAKGKRHGDVAIAAMHLVAAAQEDAGPLEVLTAGQRSHLAGGDGRITTTGFGTIGRRASAIVGY